MSAIPMERPELEDDEAAALAELAARVRELAEAAVLTRAGAAEATAIAGEVAALTARLTAERRDAPPFVTPGERTMDHQIANPVTGTANPIAPPVVLTVGALYEGPPSYVHGGVSAMVLDQALGMAAAASGTPGMTATLETRYRRPTPLGVPLQVEAKASRVEGRKVYASGAISAPDGRVTVEATAMFIMPQRFVTSPY
ncbi:Thioesterase superfamily protein [Actinomadura madurae]|uniref:Acyl-coenzyme A thioesterase THEM4 n=1 Tax=Actinomadura madurae TaxID=1993 RepID=A0A1I4W921_9ACTN|nr:PaaI family thioesterase [Actinomadura madurae]SFN09945.1 Thioesterase superfamily protein [Actinomadura madurae]